MLKKFAKFILPFLILAVYSTQSAAATKTWYRAIVYQYAANSHCIYNQIVVESNIWCDWMRAMHANEQRERRKMLFVDLHNEAIVSSDSVDEKADKEPQSDNMRDLIAWLGFAVMVYTTVLLYIMC